MADKGYDSAVNRKIDRKHGALPVMPHRRNPQTLPDFFATALHPGGARIEQAVGKLKRIALRCEKITRNFGSFVALVAAFTLVKIVQTV